MAGKKGRSGRNSPGRRTAEEERAFKDLIRKSYNYLLKNFNSFTADRRFYLALEIIKKAMPSYLIADGFGDTHYHFTTVKEAIEYAAKRRDELTADDRPQLEYNSQGSDDVA